MKSARINFGQPNTEYKLEINEAGEATSCYNQDTDTEYIGGGGGGDFSIAEVTITSDANAAIVAPLITDDGESCAFTDTNFDAGTTTVYVILYKGTAYGRLVDASGSGSGGVEVDEFGEIVFTGDGSITITAQ